LRQTQEKSAYAAALCISSKRFFRKLRSNDVLPLRPVTARIPKPAEHFSVVKKDPAAGLSSCMRQERREDYKNI
jgi:hypothetical protein